MGRNKPHPWLYYWWVTCVCVFICCLPQRFSSPEGKSIKCQCPNSLLLFSLCFLHRDEGQEKVFWVYVFFFWMWSVLDEAEDDSSEKALFLMTCFWSWSGAEIWCLPQAGWEAASNHKPWFELQTPGKGWHSVLSASPDIFIPPCSHSLPGRL